jgi:phosphohistidine phosphatase SixA
MKILLMRHGEAVRGDGMDEARHLSRTGRHETLSVARELVPKLRGARVSFVVSSHLVRAVQTAEIVAHELTSAGVEIDPMVHADPIFEPDGPARHAAQRLEKLALEHAPGIVLCACHEPIVRGIAAHLTHRAHLGHFATSGVILVEDGHLRWSLDPKSLA